MHDELKPSHLTASNPYRRFWAAYKKPIFLVSLVVGLALFLNFLPRIARSALFAALLAQQTIVILLCLFALLALSLLWSAGQRLDAWVFQWINLRGYHARWVDRAMWIVTQIGNMLSAFLLAGLFFAFNVRSLSVDILFGTLTLWLVVETVKAMTDRSRPFLEFGEARVIGWKERGRSFPSGHTAQTFFLTTLLIRHFHLGLAGTLGLYALAVLVGFTRIYVGAHYPRDVMAGAVLGSIWGVLAILVDSFWLGYGF